MSFRRLYPRRLQVGVLILGEPGAAPVRVLDQRGQLNAVPRR
jgi:hypothetical protein